MANAPLFPVTVVGSWPRSTELVRALRRKEAGEITLDEFNAIADAEVLACIRAQEEAGVDIVSDGELRRDNFYSFAVDKLNGMQLMKVSELLDYSRDRARMEEMLRALDVPSFAIKSPIVVDRIGKRQGLALDELAFIAGAHGPADQDSAPRPLHADPLQLVRGPLRPGVPYTRRPRRRRGGHPSGRDNRPARPGLRLRAVGRAHPQPGGVRRGKHRDVHVRRPAQPPRPHRRVGVRGPADE